MQVHQARRIPLDLAGYWKLMEAIFPEAGRRCRSSHRLLQPVAKPTLVRRPTLDRRLTRGRLLAMIEDSDRTQTRAAVKLDLRQPTSLKNRDHPSYENSVRRNQA